MWPLSLCTVPRTGLPPQKAQAVFYPAESTGHADGWEKWRDINRTTAAVLALANVVKEWKAVPRASIDFPASTCQDAASCDLFDVIASDFSAETWGALKPSCDAFAQQLKKLPWSQKQPYLCDTFEYNVEVHPGPAGECQGPMPETLRFACDYGPQPMDGRGGYYASPCDYGCDQTQPEQCVKCCYDPDEDADVPAGTRRQAVGNVGKHHERGQRQDNRTPACDGSIPVCQFYGAQITTRNGDPNPLTVGGTYQWSSAGITEPSGDCSQRCPEDPWDYYCKANPNAVTTCKVDLERMIMPNTSYAMTTIISDGMSSICTMLGGASITEQQP